MLRTMSLLIGITVTSVGTTSAQARWDAAQQAYFLPVHNDSGVLVEAKLVPANLVRGGVTTAVESLTAGRWLYKYSFGVDGQSPQGLGSARVPCPAQGSPETRGYRSDTTGAFADVFAEVRQMVHGPRVCEFLTNLGGGRSGQGRVESSYLPGLTQIVLVGSGGLDRWPTSDATVETASYHPFVDSILGYTPNGLALRVPGIAPIVAPPAPGDPGASATALGEQVTAVCGSTDWISPKGICQSLSTKVRQVQSAITRENWTAARGALGALAQELGAQDGRHVAPDAVALISIWIGRIWSDLPTGTR